MRWPAVNRKSQFDDRLTPPPLPLAGGDGGPAAGVDDDQLAGQLQRHHPLGRGRGRQEAEARGQAGHSAGRVPPVHPEHLRRHPLHPYAVDRGHRRGRPGLHHRVHVLLYSEFAPRGIVDVMCSGGAVGLRE